MGYYKTNEYRKIDESTVAIQVINSIHGNVKVLISPEDEERARKLYWNVVLQGNKKLYVRAHTPKWLQITPVFVTIHRYLLDFPSDHVDHVNGDTLDNRRGNIRLAQPWQNSVNREHKKGSSGYRGVVDIHKGKYKKTFQASINVAGKTLYLGYFETAKEGAIAYNIAAKEHHKEFARLNNV